TPYLTLFPSSRYFLSLAYIITLLAVIAYPANIRQQASGLAFNVSAHVPGIGLWNQGCIGHFVVVLGPGILGFLRSLNFCLVLLAHVNHAVRDPVYLLLQAGGHVAQCRRRRQRRTGHEQVGIPVYLQAHRSEEHTSEL